MKMDKNCISELIPKVADIEEQAYSILKNN